MKGKNMISVVIPVHNALPYLKRCLTSLEENTSSEYELIIIDDVSDKETKEFLASYVLSFKGKIQLITNIEHKWVNYNWNTGVSMVDGTHIAVINSDIELPKYWDKELMNTLISSMIACPYEVEGNIAFTIKPFMPPHMIKGPCFMFKAKDVDKLFPIPEQIRHWCGDNVIADRCLKCKGNVAFNPSVIITHGVTKSSEFSKGQEVERKEYWGRVLKDIDEYIKIAHKNSLPYIKPIRANIQSIVNKL